MEYSKLVSRFTLIVFWLLVGCGINAPKGHQFSTQHYDGYVIQHMVREINSPNSDLRYSENFNIDYSIFCRNVYEVESYLTDISKLKSLSSFELSNQIGDKQFQLFSDLELNEFGYEFKLNENGSSGNPMNPNSFQPLSNQIGNGLKEIFSIQKVSLEGIRADHLIIPAYLPTVDLII